MIVPFVQLTGSATTASMQQRMNSNSGATLLRAYFGIYPLSESDLTTYTHNDSFVVSYNTYMDGLRLQDFTIQSIDATHWLFKNETLKVLEC